MALRAAAAGGVLLLALPTHAAPVKVGRAIVTYYWVVDEAAAKYRLGRAAVLRDPSGRVIAHTKHRFKIDLVKQGAGRLRDGRMVIFIKRVSGESRFRVHKSEFGLSTNGCPLVPYRTVAVDPRFVKLGTRLFIPQLKGTRLPDGTVHDGMFVASDRGHFRGAHVDFFVGVGARGARPFLRKGYRSRSHVTVFADGVTKRCTP